MSLIDGRTEVEASWQEVRAKAGQLNQVFVAFTSELSLMKGGAIRTGETNVNAYFVVVWDPKALN